MALEIFILPQRMTTSQMNDIPLPRSGLTIYNTTTSSFYRYSGESSSWEEYTVGGGGGALPVTLALGNTTGGNDLIVSAGDQLQITDATPSMISQIGSSKEVTSSDIPIDIANAATKLYLFNNFT